MQVMSSYFLNTKLCNKMKKLITNLRIKSSN